MATSELRTVLWHIRRLVPPRAFQELTDSQLVNCFSHDHDEAAFAELMRRHGPLVWRVCRHRLERDQDAEDAFQATFLVLAVKADSIKRRQALASWLHGAAYRSASHIVRQTARRRHHEREATAVAKSQSPSDTTWRELQAVVDEELQRLPEKYRAPFVLCCLEGKTKPEAARQLGWKEGTVSGRLALARKQLQQRLIRRGISLSLVLGVSALTKPATADVPGRLVDATVRVALAAAGQGAATGLVSGQVAAAVKAVTQATFFGKLKLAAFILLSIGLVATGAEVISHQQTSGQALSSPRQEGDGKGEVKRKTVARPKEADPSLARITGRIVDEQGHAVAGAAISTLELGTNLKRPATKSAADGSFLLVLDQPAVRYITLLATEDDGTRQGLFEITDSDSPLEGTAQVRIVMKPSRTIKVHVTDGQGKAVEAAAVEVFNSYIPLVGAVTGADGRVALRVPADAQIYWVVGVKPGAGFDYFENYRSWPGNITNPPPTEVSLVLEGARTVRIQAVDSQNKPVPGVAFVPWLLSKIGKIANVNLSGASTLTSLTAKTDQQGIATFDWIPKHLKDGIQFEFLTRGYCLPETLLFDPAREPEVLTARLLKSGSMRGKVIKQDGKPAPGILLQAEGSRSRLLARSGADGSYSFATDPRRSYIIAVTDDNWAAPSRRGISVQEGQTLQDLDFRVGKGTLVSGKVTVGRAEKPAPGQTVTLFDTANSPSGHLVRWASTDKNGHYQFRVGPGYYEIWAPETKHLGLTVEKQDKIEMNFNMDRLPRGLIMGTVYSGTVDNKPVAKAIIQGASVGLPGHAGFKAVTDIGGRFQTERWRDRMHLYAADPDGKLATFMTIGEEDEKVEIVLREAGKIKGRLVNAMGKPWPAVRVVGWMTRGPKEALEGRGTTEALTDNQGRFTLAGLVVGARCLLRVELGSSVETKEVQIKDIQTIDLGEVAVEVP